MNKNTPEPTRRGFLRKSIGAVGGLGLALSLPVLNGCEETTFKNAGPTGPVVDNELTLDTSTTEYEDLAVVGALVSVNAIMGGEELRLMVYRFSETEASTMTRVCTHLKCDLGVGQFGSGDIIDADTVQCGCHTSQFNLLTGEVEKGPATEDLKTYETTIDGNIITIKLA